MKTSKLIGKALDWAVGQAHGDGDFAPVEYSTKWEFGGPIIETEEIQLVTNGSTYLKWEAVQNNADDVILEFGSTALIAAMRCYVASKLGDEVDVPEELK